MSRRIFGVAAGVFLAVLAAQLFLVAGAGTDIPYQDQWAVEGRQIFPHWVDGSWRAVDLLAPHNEHRIAWTKASDLALFVVNGQWDPLVELVFGAVLRAGAAALLAAMLVGVVQCPGWAALAGVTVAYLPHLAWQNCLWGFQSQVFFSLGFSIATFGLLAPVETSAARKVTGLFLGIAAALAMGAGLFVPWVLLGLTALRGLARRKIDFHELRAAWPVWILVAVTLGLHHDVPGHAALRPASVGQFVESLARAAAWPHVWTPIAAVGLNLPIVAWVIRRMVRRSEPLPGEDFVLLLGGWAVAMVVAMAWTRGGSDEFDGGVPSRYADFLVLLPIANAWCAVAWVRVAALPRRSFFRAGAIAWGLFLGMGWLGLSAEVTNRLLVPRFEDRDAPVRVAQAFQRVPDPEVLAGQPLLYVPDRDPATVNAVLEDPRLKGRLPPSLQRGHPMGPLSRAARFLLRR